MKLTPAHSKEADMMAERLLKEFIAFKMPININLTEQNYEMPELGQIKELLAKSMGWVSWNELIEFVKKPHTPIYADDNPELFDVAVEKISSIVGFDYPHGHFCNMLMNAGIGFTAEESRHLESIQTPWGPISEKTEVAEGITVVSTPSHGGIILSEDRQLQVPEHLSNGSAFYEEDCEVNLVYLAFPDVFLDKLPSALGSFSIALIASKSIPRKRNLSQKHEAMLKDILSNTLDFGIDGEMTSKNTYVAPEDDPMNRECTAAEKEAIDYLARCVYFNRTPVKAPTNQECPTLLEWVESLSTSLRIDGRLPMLSTAWKKHFANAKFQ